MEHRFKAIPLCPEEEETGRLASGRADNIEVTEYEGFDDWRRKLADFDDTREDFDVIEKPAKKDESRMRIFDNPDFGQVRTIVDEFNEPWFVGRDIANILGYKYPANAIQDHVDEEDKMVMQLSDIQSKLPDHMKSSKIIVINQKGISSLIFKSDKLSMNRKIYLAGTLNIPVSYFSRKEIEFKEELLDFFESMRLSIESQYKVGRYHVDFYIPHLNLAIEYDEKEHRRYDSNLERRREAFILNKLNCRMIRVSDKNSNAYNLGLIAKELFINKQDFKVNFCY